MLCQVNQPGPGTVTTVIIKYVRYQKASLNLQVLNIVFLQV